MNRCPVSLVVLRIKQSVVKLFFQSFSQYRFLLPCLHYVTMALSLNHSRAVAKAAGRAKAKAKTKVKARTRATAKAKQRVRTAAKNQSPMCCGKKAAYFAFEACAAKVKTGGPQGDPGGIRGGSGSKKGDPRHSRHCKTNENRGIHCMQLAFI